MLRYALAMLLVCSVLGTAGPAYGAKDEGGAHAHDAKHAAVKLKVEYKDADKKSQDRVFDMSNAADQKEFLDIVNKAEHPHVTMEEKLDVFGLKRWDTGIYSIIVFVCVFLVLAKFAWKPMLQGLNEREASIRTALDQAERTRKEAAEQHAKLQAQINEGANKVREMMEEGRRDAIALKEQMMAEARTEIQAERDRVRREIDTAKDAALEELWAKSVQLATQLSSKAIRRQLTVDDHRRLVDETLAELKLTGSRPGAL